MNDHLDELTERRALRLMISLLLLLALQPFASNGLVGRAILGLLFILVAVLGAMAVQEGNRHRMRLFGLATLAAVASGAFVMSFQSEELPLWFSLAFPIFVLMFLVDVTRAILVFVVGNLGSSKSKLYFALSAYLLMGIMFAMAYLAIWVWDPSSVIISDAIAADLQPASLFIYFSFVTLTTLGYGDIQPISAGMRSLAILEAVTGVLYVAVMVASLVSALSAKDPKNDD